MNKFSSIFRQILQIFSRSEFYRATIETGAEKGPINTGHGVIPESISYWGAQTRATAMKKFCFKNKLFSLDQR